MQAYNQTILLEKLNKYLQLENRSLQLTTGYCHGITLLWLHCMANKTESWFYSTIKNIVCAENKHDFDLINTDIEKFLSHIEWLQHSDHYLHDVHQPDIDILLEKSGKFSLSFLVDENQFNDVLLNIITKNTTVCLCSHNHTIGVFKRENHFYIFDPNSDRGFPVITDDFLRLKKEIYACFYPPEIYLTQPVPLTIHTFFESKSMPDKKQLLEKFLTNNKHINDPGIAGITNLYLACKVGDAEEVQLLLKHKADPNQVSFEGWTPLMAAASKGYLQIVKDLLMNGAKSNFVNVDGFTALTLATACHHEETVKLLLEHQNKFIPKNILQCLLSMTFFHCQPASQYTQKRTSLKTAANSPFPNVNITKKTLT